MIVDGQLSILKFILKLIDKLLGVG